MKYSLITEFNKNNTNRILAIYVFVFFIIMPLLSPLRVAGITNAIYIIYILNPLTVILLVLENRIRPILRPNSHFNFILILTLIQCATIGASNLFGENQREYFSHLFQISSAYVMFNIGARKYKLINYNKAKLYSLLAILAYISATLITIYIMSSFGAGRFYTPAYTLLLPAAYSGATSPIQFLGVFVLALFSNKRGVIMALSLTALLVFFIIKYPREILIRYTGLCVLTIATILIFASGPEHQLLTWAEQNSINQLPIEKVLKITINRTHDLYESFFTNELDVNLATAGRIEEINTVLDSMDYTSWMVGRGAGSTVTVHGNKKQNIHFSPLSIAMFSGIPFMIYLYLYSISTISKAMRARYQNVNQRIMAIYAISALIHSLTAYSLFIDLLFFFALGCLTSMNRELR